MKPFPAIHFFGKKKLVITTPYGFIGSHFHLVFPIFLSNSVSILSSKSFTKVEGLLEKLSKNGFFKRSVFTTINQGQTKVFPKIFLHNQQRYPILLAQWYQSLKSNFLGLFLTYCFLLYPFLNFTHVLIDALVVSFHVKLTEKFQ